MRLDEMMLVANMPAGGYTEHQTADGRVRLPANSRATPIDAGYVLTWQEHRKEPRAFQPGQARQGMVIGLGPLAESVWVIPDERRVGEGYAVLVRQVTSADGSRAARWVDGPGDFRSTAEWQRPRMLPRALLRVDRLTYEQGEDTVVRFLHSRTECPAPTPLFSGCQVVRGEPAPVGRVYVFRSWIHPASERPTIPDGPHGGRHVPACGTCLQDGEPV